MRSRSRAPLALPILLPLAACASGGGADSGPPVFYHYPDADALTYVRSDTTDVDLETPMGSMAVQVGSEATLSVMLAPAAEGIRVTMTFDEFSARIPDPMGGSNNVTGEGIEGPLVWTFGNTGEDVSVQTKPELSRGAEEVVSPLSLANDFFPRLPGRPVQTGESWSDTVSYSGAEGEQEISATSRLTYTVAGDTVVDGRALQVFRVEGTEEVEVRGSMQGMDFTQSFSGTREGHVLWDFSRGTMVETVTHREMQGTMDLPAAGVPPMPLEASGTTRTVLQGG